MQNKKKFIKHIGIVVPMNIPNIDTDSIIPKQFLQTIKRKGLGKYLFYDWRYINGNKNKKNNDFILNQKIFENASIILTRENFGCGSSREHALWSLTDYGIKIIIASSFADIFYSNAINNQLLPIILEKHTIEKLFNIVLKNPGIKFKVNIKKLNISVFNNTYYFKMTNSNHKYIMNRVDNISMTLKLDKKIKCWENKHNLF